MRKLFLLPNQTDVKTRKKEYLAPYYIFVPITDRIIKQIKIDDKILKNDYFTKNDYSSISGQIKGKKDCQVLTDIYKTIVIQNNYKEQKLKKQKKNYIDNINKMADSTLIRKLNNKNKNLVLLCFSDNPDAYNTKYYINDTYHDLLDALDTIKKAYSFNNIYIIVKDTERQSIEKFVKIIGNYPEIKFIIIPNVYPIINTDYIKSILKIKDSCILSFKEFYQLFHIINYGSNCNEIFVTINIEPKEPIVIKTKIGILIKELIDYLKINYQEYDIYINGLIGGIKIDSIENLILSYNLESITFTKQKLEKPLKCINCGNCLKYCPVRINPKDINKDKMITISNKCIDCGLCNYICPAFIDLRKKVKGDE